MVLKPTHKPVKWNWRSRDRPPQLCTKKASNQLKNGVRTWTEMSRRKISRCPIICEKVLNITDDHRSANNDNNETHSTPVRVSSTSKDRKTTNAGDNVGKERYFHTAGTSVKCHSHSDSHVMTLDMDLPYRSLIPLLGIYPKETKNTYQKRCMYNLHS